MKRLQTIAQKLKPYRKIADIGCDHGYLIIEAFKISNDFEFIAIDNKNGPLNTCRENISKLSYSDKVRFSRSEERRVGKECTSWCRSRWSPYH